MKTISVLPFDRIAINGSAEKIRPHVGLDPKHWVDEAVRRDRAATRKAIRLAKKSSSGDRVTAGLNSAKEGVDNVIGDMESSLEVLKELQDELESAMNDFDDTDLVAAESTKDEIESLGGADDIPDDHPSKEQVEEGISEAEDAIDEVITELEEAADAAESSTADSGGVMDNSASGLETKSGSGIESVDELISALNNADENPDTADMGFGDIADSIESAASASPADLEQALSDAVDALESISPELASQAQDCLDEINEMSTASAATPDAEEPAPEGKTSGSFDDAISIAEEWESNEEDEATIGALQDLVDAIESDDIEAAGQIFADSLNGSESPYASQLEDALATAAEAMVEVGGDEED